MKNRSITRMLAVFLSILFFTALYSCEHVQYNVSASQIDSLLNANQEVHILLPEGTTIEFVETGEGRKHGENRSNGSGNYSQAEKDLFSTIRQTMGTSIMSAYASTTFQCPPYCEIVLKKPQ